MRCRIRILRNLCNKDQSHGQNADRVSICDGPHLISTDSDNSALHSDGRGRPDGVIGSRQGRPLPGDLRGVVSHHARDVRKKSMGAGWCLREQRRFLGTGPENW